MAPNKLTPAQVRDRRAKRVAIGLAVVLVAALAIQGPKLLKMINKSSPPVSASTVSVAPVSDASSTSTPSPDMVAAPATTTTPGQLHGLSRFALKDPFYAQNVTTTTATTPSTPGGSSPSSTQPSTSNPAATTPTLTLPTVSGLLPVSKTKPKTTPTTPAQSVPFTVTTPVVPPNAAVLLANGKQEIIPVGQDFPTEAPLFKLNALGKEKEPSIRISVVGGLFTNGAKTVPINRGKTIMFKNESDGTRYVIKLLRLTTVATTEASGSSTPATAAATTTASAGGSTPAPTAPASTSTPTTAAPTGTKSS